ncbi:MAG: helix-turn-helix transcriptional regulator [Sporocytophaga sp.]|uniref:helix-turn-helix domain-containing protein n=1 Tax=Sporocytophaga sp. TaxID=2231183 RepID=UPI001AFE3815|nr:AraC family transcriptional regulator [Sporocytophaga sp.]MBO9698702.1 helix-turn-helix transcriptional regulator [Sporocytophaga sp.]
MKGLIPQAFNKNLFRNFIRDTASIRLIVISFALLTAIFFVFFHKEELVLFPSDKKLNVNFYTDINDNGLSTVLSSNQNDSVIGFHFMLKKGFVLPYAGINVAKPAYQILDVSGYNRLEVEVSSKNVSDLVIYLVTKDQNVKDTTHRLRDRHSSANVEIRDKRQTLLLKFKEFSTPDWWYTAIGQPKSDFSEPEWNRLNQLSFATGLNPKVEIEGSLELYGLRFYRDNTNVLIAMSVSEFFIFIGLFLRFYSKGKKSEQKTDPVNIRYKPVAVDEKPETGYNFLDYINENFNNAELDLSQISKATGVNQRFISDTISEKFQCNFKTYVNQIRINEAKRLLKESDLNIGEIAYSVGFSSPGSFNRVFKSMTGKTPTEFQESSE